MKRYAALWSILAFTILLAGCKEKTATSPDIAAIPYTADVAWVGYTGEATLFEDSLNASSKDLSSVLSVPLFRCNSQSELETFKKNYTGVLSLSQGYNECPAFEEATKEYTADFFEDNALFLAYVTASSGSYRFTVEKVTLSGRTMNLYIRRNPAPDSVTDDMAGWLFLVGVKKADIAACTHFNAQLTIPAEGDIPHLSILVATVVETNDTAFLVEPIAGSGELTSADRIEVAKKHCNEAEQVKVGDQLEIEYNGEIQETYPAGLGKVYAVRVVDTD